jgi:hypothetical protein
MSKWNDGFGRINCRLKNVMALPDSTYGVLFTGLQRRTLTRNFTRPCDTVRRMQLADKFVTRHNINVIHKENLTRCNSVSKCLFHIYMKLNMFRASCKYEINILIHCCILMDFLCELYCDARIHEHQVITLYL